METLVISQVGNFSVRIAPFWDCTLHDTQYRIKETNEVCHSQNKAIRTAKRILKKKRVKYRETHPKVKRIRTIPPVCETNPPIIKEKNRWIQMNITNE